MIRRVNIVGAHCEASVHRSEVRLNVNIMIQWSITTQLLLVKEQAHLRLDGFSPLSRYNEGYIFFIFVSGTTDSMG